MSVFKTDELCNFFIDALTEVISKMAGLPFNVLSSEPDNTFDGNTAVMSLNGKNHGLLFISANDNTMRIICSSMTGIPNNEVTIDDIEDSLCELVNMTAGNAKLRTNNQEMIYTITPPFIIKGERLSLKTKKRINLISLTLGNSEFSVKLKIIIYI